MNRGIVEILAKSGRLPSDWLSLSKAQRAMLVAVAEAKG